MYDTIVCRVKGSVLCSFDFFSLHVVCYSVIFFGTWHNSSIDKRDRETDEAQLAHFSYLKKISALLWLCFGLKSSLFTICGKEKKHT